MSKCNVHSSWRQKSILFPPQDGNSWGSHRVEGIRLLLQRYGKPLSWLARKHVTGLWSHCFFWGPVVPLPRMRAQQHFIYTRKRWSLVHFLHPSVKTEHLPGGKEMHVMWWKGVGSQAKLSQGCQQWLLVSPQKSSLCFDMLSAFS